MALDVDVGVDTQAMASSNGGGARPPASPAQSPGEGGRRPRRHRRRKRGTQRSAEQPTHHTEEEEEEPSSSSSSSSSSTSSSSPSSSRRSSSSSAAASSLPPPPTPAVTELGKRSVEANAQLMRMFADMAAEQERNHPFQSAAALLTNFLSFDCLCGLYAAAVCFAGYGYLGVVHMLVEAILLTLLVAAVVAINMWRTYLEVSHRGAHTQQRSPTVPALPHTLTAVRRVRCHVGCVSAAQHSELVRLLRARMKLVLELPSQRSTPSQLCPVVSSPSPS